MLKVLFFLFTTAIFLNDALASYDQKIIVASFLTQSDADKALINLEKQINTSSRNISTLQKGHAFQFVARQSGRYYIVSVEPFSDTKVLKIVLNTVRYVHKDAFVNRIKIPKKTVKPQLGEMKDIDISVTVEEPVMIETTPLTDIIEHKPHVTHKVEDLNTTVTVPLTEIGERNTSIADHSDTHSSSLWIILFTVSSLLFIATSILLIFAKKEYTKLRAYTSKTHENLLVCQDKIVQTELYIAKISHELRTPMNAIIGLSHIVIESDIHTIQKDNVSKIKNSAELLLDIVNDILDLSKIEAGELTIETVNFNLNEMLDHVSTMVALSAEDKGLELIFDIDKGVPSHLLGDPLRIGQILINLLGNAIKFTKEGGVDLHIYTLSRNETKVMLEFNITDSGIGMTSDQMSKLFQSFSQADDSMSRLYGGTGLGLSISKQLVEMMNGSIRIESQLDHGSSFIFNIELDLQDTDNSRFYRLPNKDMMSKSVLIIDTNTKRILSLSKMLQYFHYNIRVMPTFEEAQSILENVELDLLFMDEEKFSNDAVIHINRLKKRTNVRTVLMESLYNQNKNSTHGTETIDRYLIKPFNPQNVFSLIIDLYGTKTLTIDKKQKTTKDDLKVLSGKQILVVEDNKINQFVIEGLLDETGIELTMADNGKIALDILEENSDFSLILMDISMPVMDGYEATKRIRSLSKYDKIPIVALSANAMEDEIEHAISSGMQGYIGKPFDVDTLYKKILDITQSSLSNI